MNIKIGIDFDNTIVCYDDIFHSAALAKGYIKNDVLPQKKIIRDIIRKNFGEVFWQKLQLEIYGTKIIEAKPFVGVIDFILDLLKLGFDVYIISHKSQYASIDKAKSKDLIAAARNWLDRYFFFNLNQNLFQKNNIFFEPSRIMKIQRIRSLGCNIFIDDLLETFLDKNFPEYTRKILFSCCNFVPNKPSITQCSDWREIRALILKEYNVN